MGIRMAITPYYDDGQITIYHADCRDVLPMIHASEVDLVLTDPPYGVSFDTDYSRFTGGMAVSTDSHSPVHGDTEPFDPGPLVDRFERVILFGANAFSDRLPKGSWVVWDKRVGHNTSNLLSDGEVAWYSRGHGVYIHSHTWNGFQRDSERGTAHHPTQKPVSLMRWILDKWSKSDELILDPYMGSGPIARACADMKRRYIGIEIEERYFEIAVKRLQQSWMNLEVA